MAVGQQEGMSRFLVVLIGVVLSLILAIAYYALFHMPLAQKQSELMAQRQEMQASLKTLQENATDERLAALKTEIENIKALIAEYEGKLPTKEEIPKLLDDFANVARENGIKFVRVEAKDLEILDDYVKKPLQVEAAADYFQAMDLFYVLEYGERIGTVEGFRLEPSDSGGAQGKKGASQAASSFGPGKMDVGMDMAIFALEKSS